MSTCWNQCKDRVFEVYLILCYITVQYNKWLSQHFLCRIILSLRLLLCCCTFSRLRFSCCTFSRLRFSCCSFFCSCTCRLSNNFSSSISSSYSCNFYPNLIATFCTRY